MKKLNRCSTQKKLQRSNSPQFAPRSNMYNDAKKMDAIVEKNKKEQKVLDECTFSPNISYPKPQYIRHPDDFYRDQKIHEMNKIYRINQIEKEMHDKENKTGKPYLSKVSSELASKREFKDKSIHERLYKEFNSKKIKEGLEVLISLQKDQEHQKRRKSG